VAAQDNLNGDQFFHGSSYEFKPGDELTVSGAQGFSGTSKRKLYFSDDVALASSFGGNVYRVTPTGDHTRKRRPRDKQEPGFPTEYEYSTRHPLRVEGKVPEDDIWAARKARTEHFLATPEGKAWQKRQGAR
jgi:hypothetical protein